MPVYGLGRQCSEEGCTRPAVCGDLCVSHWQLQRAFGRIPDAEEPEFEAELQHSLEQWGKWGRQ